MIEDYKILKKLDDGGSPVKKTILEKNNLKFILRKYNPKYMDSRYKSFEIRKQLRNVNMPNIVEYGSDYAIYEYIDGYSLDKLSSNQMKEYAYEAAQELRKMHSNKNSIIDIYESYDESLSKKMKKITNLTLKQLDAINGYTSSNKEILRNRDASIIHGDFHPGNIIVNPKGVFLIDLDMLRFGEAYKDLVNIFPEYEEFYNELYKYYFDGKITDEFYVIYNLYSILLLLDYIIYSKREFNNDEKGFRLLNNYMEKTNYLKNERIF